jgi:hypothetical protein
VRTNRPNKAAEARHRKPGPARLAGGDAGGKRARDIAEDETADDVDSADPEEAAS